jgi:ubiquinone/menaquinone biosynthesis C-methylase UbiE
MTQLEFMNALRTEEMRSVLQRHHDLFAGKDILEIGSGTGVQLLVLRDACKSVTGIEIKNAWFHGDSLVETVPYDGQRIPFPDASFDVVYSSSVMEHIANEKTIHAEIHRVLRGDGVCFHIVPTAAWRISASIAHYPAYIKKVFHKLFGRRIRGANASDADPGSVTLDRWLARLKYALVAPRHGEFGNWFTEHAYIFRVRAWRNRFESHGWQVESMGPIGFFQTGYYVLGQHLNWRARIWLARVFGSSTFFFILRSVSASSESGLDW